MDFCGRHVRFPFVVGLAGFSGAIAIAACSADDGLAKQKATPLSTVIPSSSSGLAGSTSSSSGAGSSSSGVGSSTSSSGVGASSSSGTGSSSSGYYYGSSSSSSSGGAGSTSGGASSSSGGVGSSSAAASSSSGGGTGCTNYLGCKTLYIAESNFTPSADGSSLKFTAYVFNASINGTLALADVKFRYYFTSSMQPLGYQTHCYYASDQNVANSGGATITMDVNFASGSSHSTTPGGAYYYEISFASTVPALLAAPAGYASIQVEIDGTTGSFTPATDYSYIAGASTANSQTTAVPNPHMTGYLSGTLVWGAEP